jgi:hypothetical protein
MSVFMRSCLYSHPDELYRQLNAKTALEGSTVKQAILVRA